MRDLAEKIRLTIVAALVISVGVVISNANTASALPPTATYRDDFASEAYNLNTGTLNFAGAWDEDNDGSGATGGKIQVQPSGVLDFDSIDSDDRITRLLDLSPHSGSNVVLTIGWSAESGSEEQLGVELRNSGGTWEEVTVLDNDDSDHPSLPYTVVLQLTSDQISSQSGIRFDSSSDGWGDSDDIEIDFVEFAVGTIATNPDLPVACGIDVTVVLDESGSINSESATGDVENAVRALIDGLKNTGSRLKFTEFSTNGRAASIGGDTGFQSVDAGFETAVENYLTGGGNAENATSYNPGTGQQWTNWEAGLAPVGTPGQLVVFITDGQPNTVGTAGSSIGGAFNGEEQAAAGAALDELDAIKATGAHVLAIGVGAASNNDNFNLLTRTVEPGTAQVYEGVGTLDLQTVDAIRVPSFSDLDTALRQVVFALCAPSISIDKVDDAGKRLEQFAFDGTVDVDPYDLDTAFEWVTPDVGPATGPNTQTSSTGGDGDPGTDDGSPALFQWTPGSVDAPVIADSTFEFTETLATGWSVGTLPQCDVRRLGSDGNVQNLKADLVANRVGQVVTFSLEVPGTDDEFLLTKADIVTCEVVNNRPATITITKDAQPNSPQDFSFTGVGGKGLPGSFDLDDDADGTLPSSRSFTVEAPGNYSVSEGAETGWEQLSNNCDPTGTAASISVQPGGTIECTFVNVGSAQLQLDKLWVIAEPGDTATLTANEGGGDPQLTFGATAGPGDGTKPIVNERDSSSTITIPIGEGIAIAETLGQPASYTSGLSCSSTDGDDDFTLSSVATDGRSGTVTANVDAVGETITCEFANPSVRVDVVVQKQVVGPDNDTGTFDLFIDDLGTPVATGGDGTSNAGSPKTVDIGDSVKIDEAPAGSTNGDWYTLGFPTCSYPGGDVTAVADLVDGGYDFTVPLNAAGTTVTCTFVNTRKTADVSLQKNWVNPANGDSTELSVDPTIGTASTASAPENGSGIVAPAGTTDVPVYVGDTVTLSETLAGGNTGSYTITAFSCTGGTPDSWSTDDPDLVVTVTSDADITCTVTNTRTAKKFILNKTWTDPVGGELIDLDADGDDPAGDTAIDVNGVESPTSSLGNEMDVLSGETVAFSESFVVPANASNFTTTLECNDEPVAYQTENGVLSASIDVDAYVGNITCVFDNTRKSTQLTLAKEWVNAADNGAEANDSVTLQIDATNDGSNEASQVASAPDGGNGASAAEASTTVYAGTTAKLSEVFGVNTGSYDVTVFTCAPDANATWSSAADDLDATVLITSAAVDAASSGDGSIDCSITNTRRSALLKLTKQWNDAFDGDDVTMSIVGAESGAGTAGSSVAPGTVTTDAELVVFSGETVTLSETFGADVADDGTGYSTTIDCTQENVTTPGGTPKVRSTTYVVPADPTPTTCTFTNAGASDVTVEKEFVSASDDDFDGIYDVRYTITVTNEGPAADSYDLSDTPAFDTDLDIDSGTVSSTTGITPVPVIADFTTAPWSLATGQAIAGSNDPDNLVTHVYTLDFEVDATGVIEGPDTYDPCDPEPARGKGLFNEATLTVDQVPTTVDDCGDLELPDLNIEKSDPVITGPDANGKYQAVYTVTVTNVGPVATQYDLVDDPTFSPGLSIDSGSATATGGPANPGVYPDGTWTLAGNPATPPGDQPIAVDGVHTYTLTFVVDGNDLLDGTTDLVECADTPLAGQGLFNEATLTYAGQLIEDDGCGNPPLPTVTIDKTVTSVTDSDFDGIYDVVYSIVVTNTSSEDTEYDLTDKPNFDDDLVILDGVDAPSAVGENTTEAIATPIAPLGGFMFQADTSTGNWPLVAGEPIAAGDEHTYTLTFRVDATGLIESPTATIAPCAGEAGAIDEGLFNDALLSYAGQDKNDSACDVPDLPDLEIAKTFDSATDADFDGIYEVVYTVTVTNNGSGATQYDLTDSPDFDDDLVLLSGTASADIAPAVLIPPLTDPGTELPYQLADDQQIDEAGGDDSSHVYTLTFQVDANALIEPLDGTTLTECTDQDPNADEALYNEASATYAGKTIDAEDCGEPPLPDLDVVKSVADLSGPDADGKYTVEYDITVTNNGDAPTSYSLNDTPGFDSDLTIDSGSALADTGETIDDYTLPNPWVLATDQPIDEDGGTDDQHVYTLTFVVDGSAVLADPSLLDECSQEPVAGEGLFNEALLTYVGGDLPTEDCDTPDVPELTVDKDFVSATDADLDGIYDVTYTVTVTNVSDFATSYDLDDNPSFDADLNVVSGEATASTGETIADYTLTNPWVLATAQAIAASGDAGGDDVHTYTLSFVVDANNLIEPTGEPPLPELDLCTGDDGEAGEALFNAATLTYNGRDRDAQDCGEPALPDLTVTKSVASLTGPAANGTYTVSYDIVVENEGGSPTEYDLSDTPGFDSDFVIDGTPTAQVVADPAQAITPLPYTSGTWDLVDDEPIAADQTHTYTLTFVVDGSAVIDNPDLLDPCGDEAVAGEAFFNQADLTYLGNDLDDSTCVTPGVPTLEVTKSVIDGLDDPAQPEFVSGNTYTVTYDVDVNNIGTVDGTYVLTDDPTFNAKVTITNIAIGGDVSIPDYTPGAVINTADLPAGESDSYTVTVTFDVDPEMTAAERSCSAEGGQSGEATYNLASIVYNNGGTSQDNDCADIPEAEISVEKVRTSDTATRVDGTTYEAEFTITVDNDGDGPGAYSLEDLPAVAGDNDPDVTIDPEIAPTDVIDIEAGGEDVYTVTVRFDVAGDLSSEERDCIEGRETSGEGAFNSVTVSWNDEQTSTDQDCIDIPAPNVDYDKVLQGEQPVFNGDNEWTVTYDVTVTNLDDGDDTAGPALYSIDDQFAFIGAPGVTVDNVGVTTTPADLDNVGFNGDDNTTLADGVTIGGDETHTYTVVVDVTIVPVQGIDGDCDGEGGLLNIAQLSVATDVVDVEDEDQREQVLQLVAQRLREPREACADFSTLTLVKDVDNEFGGNAEEEDFTLTASQGDTVVLSGDGVAAGSVPAGEYSLAESGPDGYTTEGYICEGGEQDGESVLVPVGANVTCEIINEDTPVDLQVTKTDGGFVATAGDPEPFDYTITVSNLGPREVDDEPVTVVDELPAAFEWVAPAPAGCSIAGQTLTCDVDPADLRPAGTEVVITATAQVADGANAGIYDNQVTVTTEDDPVGDVPPCSNPDAIGANNNVDCEPTEVESTLRLNLLEPVCVKDAPHIDYDITPLGFTPTGGATATFYDIDGVLIETRSLPTLQGAMLYPGAEIDSEGNATDWPGWKFEGGLWVPDPEDDHFRQGVRVVFEVNPTVEGTVSYPDADSGCADPTQVSADLAIVKTASQAVVGAGGGFDWVLEITNNGPDTATGVEIGDLVPSEVNVDSVSSDTFDCGNDGNNVTCTVDSLAVGASGTVTISVLVPNAAPDAEVVNVATVEAVTPDPDLTNNTDDAEVTLVASQPPATPAPPPVTLPPTGSNATQDAVRLAIGFLLLGGFVVLITRRRRSPIEPTSI